VGVLLEKWNWVNGFLGGGRRSPVSAYEEMKKSKKKIELVATQPTCFDLFVLYKDIFSLLPGLFYLFFRLLGASKTLSDTLYQWINRLPHD
jgi:hypothetical protein